MISYLASAFAVVFVLAMLARAVVAFRHRAERGFVWQFLRMEDADWRRKRVPTDPRRPPTHKPTIYVLDGVRIYHGTGAITVKQPGPGFIEINGRVVPQEEIARGWVDADEYERDGD